MIYHPFIKSARCCLKVFSPFSERHLYTILPFQILLLGGRGYHSTANNNCEARAAELVTAGLKVLRSPGVEISVEAHALPPRADKLLQSLLLCPVGALPEEGEDVTNPQGHLGLGPGQQDLPLAVLQTGIASLLKTLFAFSGKSLQL